MHTDAPAKINLNLGIGALRPSGYHDVETVMCSLDLADAVEVRPSDDGRLEHVCEPDPIPADAPDRMRANIAYRAAEAMAASFGRPAAFAVRIQKSIPSQAGLGGGSSDAAAVIRCIARHWGVEPADPRCVAVAASLGADVPFFLFEGIVHLSGRGDVPVDHLPGFSAPLVLVKPPVGVSTGRAYRAFDDDPVPARPVAPLVDAVRAGDVSAVLAEASNNMERAALTVAPALAEVFAFLAKAQGAASAPLLCGSGSAVALFTVDDAAARSIACDAESRGWWSCATHTRA